MKLATIPALIILSLVAAVFPSSAQTAAPAHHRTVEHHHHHHKAYAAKAAAPVATGPQVWVNLDTGIYHMPGERWYGNTKNGEYMSQSAANAAGYRETENGQ